MLRKRRPNQTIRGGVGRMSELRRNTSGISVAKISENDTTENYPKVEDEE